MVRFLGLALCLLVACDSGSGGVKGDKPKPTKAEKAAKAAKELDDQMIAPPADVVGALGVEVYPGARMLKGFTAMRSEANGRSTVDYIFFTPDAAAKVRDFYAQKLTDVKPNDPTFEKTGVYIVKGTNANGDEVHIQARSHGEKTDFHFVITKKK